MDCGIHSYPDYSKIFSWRRTPVGDLFSKGAVKSVSREECTVCGRKSKYLYYADLGEVDTNILRRGGLADECRAYL